VSETSPALFEIRRVRPAVQRADPSQICRRGVDGVVAWCLLEPGTGCCARRREMPCLVLDAPPVTEPASKPPRRLKDAAPLVIDKASLL